MIVTHRQFFGDAERDFALLPLIEELERKTGTGFLALANRILARECKYGDLCEIIRLGLIGGGTSPEEAQALLKAYVYPRPVEEALLVAINVVAAAYFGTPAAPVEDAA